jgi:hypothetical protein
LEPTWVQLEPELSKKNQHETLFLRKKDQDRNQAIKTTNFTFNHSTKNKNKNKNYQKKTPINPVCKNKNPTGKNCIFFANS